MKKSNYLTIRLIILTCLGSLSSFAQIDVGFSSITSPSAGSEIKKGTKFNYSALIKNFGSTPVPKGTTFYFSLNFGTGAPATSKPVTLQDDLPVGATTGVQSNATCNSQPAGDVVFRIWTLSSSDTNLSNDTAKVVLKLSDVTGINDNNEMNINQVSYNNNALQIKVSGVTAGTNNIRLSVFNLEGQLITSQTLLNKGSEITETIYLPQVSTGIYLVALYHDGILINRKKFVAQ